MARRKTWGVWFTMANSWSFNQWQMATHTRTGRVGKYTCRPTKTLKCRVSKIVSVSFCVFVFICFLFVAFVCCINLLHLFVALICCICDLCHHHFYHIGMPGWWYKSEVRALPKVGDLIVPGLNLRVSDVTYSGNKRTSVKNTLDDNWECTLTDEKTGSRKRRRGGGPKPLPTAELLKRLDKILQAHKKSQKKAKAKATPKKKSEQQNTTRKIPSQSHKKTGGSYKKNKC